MTDQPIATGELKAAEREFGMTLDDAKDYVEHRIWCWRHNKPDRIPKELRALRVLHAALPASPLPNAPSDAMREAFMDALQPFVAAEHARQWPTLPPLPNWREGKIDKPDEWQRMIAGVDAGICAAIRAAKSNG